MIRELLSHGYKNYFRSPVWAKSLAVNIFLGLLALMMLSYVLLVGIFLIKIVTRAFPDSDPINIINGLVLYYFGIEFLMRFFLQNTPVLFIQPYLHLPIRKGKIIHFMLRKSFLSAFNLLAIFLFLPFAVTHLLQQMGGAATLGWIGALLGIVFLIHYFGLFFKKKLNDTPNLIFIIIGIFTALFGLEYFGILSFSDVSQMLMTQFLSNPVLALVPVLLGFLAYRANYTFLFNNTYPEEISTKKSASKIKGDFGFLKRFGTIGELIAIELKLILRHKRPRSLLILSAFLLLYGLVFYPQETYQNTPFIFVFVGIFITGLFFINHGQFMVGWQSGHFDFMLTRSVSLKQYLTSKYWMYVSASLVAFIISLAYVFFGWKIVLINFCAFLFNIGINIPMVMYISMHNAKKIDLTKGAAFNYQGVGAAQWLMAFPVLLAPYIFYLPLSLLGYEILGILAMGAVGVVGFIFRNHILTKLTARLTSKRHSIAAAFRAQ